MEFINIVIDNEMINTNDLAWIEWLELEAVIVSTSMYCEGYMGFANEIPEVVSLVRKYLSTYYEMFPLFCYHSILKLIEVIKTQDLTDNLQTSLQTSDNIGRARALCYYLYAVRSYCNGEGSLVNLSKNEFQQTKRVKWSIVRKIVVEMLFSLPQSYLRQTKVKTISSCIMSSKTIIQIAEISHLLGNCLLSEWYEDDEDFHALCPDFRDQTVVPDKLDVEQPQFSTGVQGMISILRLDEFSSQSIAYWTNACEVEASADSIRSVETTTTPAFNKQAALQNLWNKCHNLILSCTA
jgi:hypothetical protein